MTTKDLTQVKARNIRELFETVGVQEQIRRALPSFLTVDYLIRVSLTAIRTNPRLLDCSQQSLLACLMGCAQLGLTPEPYLGRAYLVPFWNSKLGGYEAQLIPGYRGYIEMARRSGEVERITADVVWVNDEFKIVRGLNENLEHIPNLIDRGNAVKGAYAIVWFLSGSPQFDFMTKEDIDGIMERSKSRDKKGNIVGPWVTDWNEMAKKTVIRRLWKLIPQSIEDNRIEKAVHVENLALQGESQTDFFLPQGDGMPPVSDVRSPDEFDEMVGPDVAGSPEMAEYLKLCAESNQSSIDEIKVEAVKEPESFRQGFQKWFDSSHGRSSEKKKSKTTAKKPASEKKKSKTTAKKPAKDKKPETSDKDKTGDGSKTGNAKGAKQISLDELANTNEWQEMSALKEQYPDVWNDNCSKMPLKSLDDVNKIIDVMNQKIDESQSSMPDK